MQDFDAQISKLAFTFTVKNKIRAIDSETIKKYKRNSFIIKRGMNVDRKGDLSDLVVKAPTPSSFWFSLLYIDDAVLINNILVRVPFFFTIHDKTRIHLFQIAETI